MSPTITDKIISSGNISSPSILQSSSRPSSLSSSTIISPSNKSTNVIDLSKFEKRLSLSDDSNNNLSSSSVKISDRNWDNQDDTALKEEKDGIITHSNINIVLTSSPSNVTKNAFTPVKLKIKRPSSNNSDEYSPTGNSEQSISPFEQRNLLSPSFRDKNDGRKSASPIFGERNLLSPSFDRSNKSNDTDMKTYNGKKLFNIVNINNNL